MDRLQRGRITLVFAPATPQQAPVHQRAPACRALFSQRCIFIYKVQELFTVPLQLGGTMPTSAQCSKDDTFPHHTGVSSGLSPSCYTVTFVLATWVQKVNLSRLLCHLFSIQERPRPPQLPLWPPKGRLQGQADLSAALQLTSCGPYTSFLSLGG